jgi:glycosyltransferase involved in cell wall biosynthesis
MAAPTIPAVSVVVPAYNAEKWIGEALASALGQTYDPRAVEILVVDDGSTDATAEAADSALKKGSSAYRVTRVVNGGPGRARNIGWRAASGAWIQFLDADDTLQQDKLSLQVGTASSVGTETAVVYSDWQEVAVTVSGASTSAPSLRRPAIDPDDPVADLLKTENFMQLGSLLFRRSWLEAVGGFDERYWLIEDVELLLRIAIHGGRFAKAPSEEPVLSYRRRPNSLSQRSPESFVEGCLRNAQMVEDYWFGWIR